MPGFSTGFSTDGTGEKLTPFPSGGGSVVDTDTDDQLADQVPYDNSGSGLTANDVQAALDELAGQIAGISDGDGGSTGNLSEFSGFGALIYLGSNLAASTGGNTPTVFDTAAYNDSVQPADAGGTQRFWLGANKTMTVASTSAGVETLTITGHGLTTGEGPILFTNSGGGLPGGISAGTKYWPIVVDANTIALATSRANALADTRVDITSAGTGTHTMATGSKLVIPAGVTRVQFVGSYEDNGSGVNVNLAIQKDGSLSYVGRARMDQGNLGTNGSTISSPTLVVSGGEYFELTNLAGGADTLIANHTWFVVVALK